MKLFKNSFIIAVSFVITSCVFVPVTADKQKYYDKCKMITKKLTIEPKIRSRYVKCSGSSDDLAICLVAAGILAPVSFVVSGSVALIGNTIHWMEYKTGCDPKNPPKPKEQDKLPQTNKENEV